MDRLVRDLMHRDFIHVSPAEPVLAVLQLMSMARVRVLPVVDGGWVRGLVAHTDLAAAVLGLTGDAVDAAAPVERFVRPVPPVSPEATLPEAAQRMVGEAIPCLVAAVEDGDEAQAVGLVTESDLLRVAYQSRVRRGPPAAS